MVCRMVHGLLIQGHEEFFIWRSLAAGQQPVQESVADLLSSTDLQEWHHAFQACSAWVTAALQALQPPLCVRLASCMCLCMCSTGAARKRCTHLQLGAGQAGAAARGHFSQGGRTDTVCGQGAASSDAA